MISGKNQSFSDQQTSSKLVSTNQNKNFGNIKSDSHKWLWSVKLFHNPTSSIAFLMNKKAQRIIFKESQYVIISKKEILIYTW